MIYHVMAFIAGFILDLFLGDPIGVPHPVRWIGNLIGLISDAFLKKADTQREKRIYGTLMVIIVLLVSGLLCFFLLMFAYKINSYFGVIIEMVITYWCIAAKSLYTESMKVYYAFEYSGLPAAREAVSMIVGRDAKVLDETGVIKATVETIAENTSDGVIAPLIYLAIGGPVLGIIYKAVNTMDSMVGYKNDKYIDFGRSAAKLDDIFNFIPSRISALLMIFSCILLGQDYSAKNAIKIYKRDRLKHSSPNSAQTESVCAGALQVQLAGPASYFGQMVMKPFIGDSVRKIELEDIKRANKLMLTTAVVSEIVWIFILCVLTAQGV